MPSGKNEEGITIANTHLCSDQFDEPEPTGGLVIGIVGRGHKPVVDEIMAQLGDKKVEIIIFDEYSDLIEYQDACGLNDMVVPTLETIKLTLPKIDRYPAMCEVSEPYKEKHYHNSPTFKRRDHKKKG